MRTAAAAFGPGATVVEPVPVHVGTAASADLRAEPTAPADSPSDIKASGLAALVASSVGMQVTGASSSHVVAGTGAMAAQPALDPAAEADLPRQIVHAMRLQWKDGIGDARIRLLPEYLGELNVAIRVEHGSVTAALEASTPAVRHWIESHEPLLRQSLAEQGLHLDRLIVLDEPEHASEPNRERRGEHGEQPQQQPRSRRRPPADETTFELIV
jgi:flagellar hook-length control protein FliK